MQNPRAPVGTAASRVTLSIRASGGGERVRSRSNSSMVSAPPSTSATTPRAELATVPVSPRAIARR